MAQTVKRLSTMRETREDPLEKEMAIHSSTIAWKIPWTAGDFPNPGIEPGSPAFQADSLPTELLGKPQIQIIPK